MQCLVGNVSHSLGRRRIRHIEVSENTGYKYLQPRVRILLITVFSPHHVAFKNYWYKRTEAVSYLRSVSCNHGGGCVLYSFCDGGGYGGGDCDWSSGGVSCHSGGGNATGSCSANCQKGGQHHLGHTGTMKTAFCVARNGTSVSTERCYATTPSVN
jgi:hypothetical protein